LAACSSRPNSSAQVFGDTHLVWRFARTDDFDLAREAKRLLDGEVGQRIGEAGLMVALADLDGNMVGANRAFAIRATGKPDAALAGTPLTDLVEATEDGQFHFAQEGRVVSPLRIVQVPVADQPNPLTLFLLLDDPGAVGRMGREGGASLAALLETLPLGLALADVDGRFVHLNKDFRQAAGLGRDARPVYPGDLVVDEDKATVSDAVRRHARGPASASDMAVRLKAHPDEPVALRIAGVRGLGDAAVALAIKDNSEADRLKRQVAQATKMQAVGQLAGGVAHDFNNILTAILGYCDLMLMRHTPGDSDYDDIQQIRSNSNRAAGLTRQLLAFSRQQTLRPQVLQLPDVISEVLNLLKRLLGETVKLQVKHGRNLGAVRADPGQLEQVIVNLAVNARDAMLTKILKAAARSCSTPIRSRRTRFAELGSDILPVAITRAQVTDTGTGIAARVLGKIFEPFFTTKEVGKGTGLGPLDRLRHRQAIGRLHLRRVEEGEGTSFTIYLPVHRAEATKPRQRQAQGERRRALGHGHDPARRGRGDGPRGRRARADPPRLYRAQRREWRGGARNPGREAQIDLMISDVVMPTMDGPTTVREARKTRPDLPILFISGTPKNNCASRSISIALPFLPNLSRSSSSPKRRATRWPRNNPWAFM
jgi:two-component system cell cycle sensor histidine kinase/response regulator CckA